MKEEVPSEKSMDTKVLLSTLWIFVMFNYLYCDVMTLMDPVMLKQFMTGDFGDIQMNENFLLGAAIMMEVPIAMILLSRILKHNINRWMNIIAGAFKTIIMIITMFIGTPAKYYLFCGTIEIITTIAIIWIAWNWKIEHENGRKNLS